MRPSIRPAGPGQLRTPATGFPAESLYGRLSSVFALDLKGPQDAGLSRHIRAKPVLGPWIRNDIDKLARLFRMPISDGVELMEANDHGFAPPWALVLELRYCAACLKFGYHGALQQHLAVTHCELHGLALQMGCPACKRPIVPTLDSISEAPLHCPQCDSQLSPDALGGAHLEAARKADGYLQRTGKLLSRHDSCTWFLTHEPTTPANCTQSSRHVWRAMMFDRALNPRGWLFPEIAYTVPATGPLLGYGAKNVISGLLPLLRFLHLACPNPEEVISLSRRLGRKPGGMRLNRPVSLIAAALTKTLIHYGLAHEFEAVHLRYRDVPSRGSLLSAPIRHGMPFAENAALDGRLYEFEILGFLAKTLVAIRPGSLTFGVDWSRPVASIEYTPSWTSQCEGDDIRIRVRARASKLSVMRLFKRVSGLQLIASDEPLDSPQF